MKKILTSILVLTMLLCCMSISAFAANRAVFTVDSVEADPGETVKINVNITENQGIAAGKVKVSVEAATITNIEQGDWSLIGTNWGSMGSGYVNVADGVYNWYYTSEHTENGVYATYTIKVDDDAQPGEYKINLVAWDLAGIYVDEDGEEHVVSYKGGEWDESQEYTGTLTVKGEIVTPPEKEELEITANPQDVTVTEDEKAAFSVTAKGEGLKYQWQKKVDGEWKDITGATSATYEIASAKLTDAGEYRVVVIDKDEDKVESSAATLTVNKKEEQKPPEKEELAITAQPKNVTVKEDEKAAFSVTAKGEGLKYQWQKKVDGEWKDITGANAATFEIAKAKLTDAGEYRVVITDKDGEKAESNPATLTVNKKEEQQNPPVVEKELKITADPKDAKVKEGEKATFTVTAEGESVTYQWQKFDGKEWKNIAGATSATYEIAKTTLDDNGAQFRVTVTDKNGKSVNSAAAKLTVEKKADTTTGGDKDKDTGKDTGKDKDKTAKTGDSTNLYIYMALCMFAAAVIVGVTYELKKNRD